jgi:hypothetical protein
MVTVEEMTRRRDCWREKAEIAVAELRIYQSEICDTQHIPALETMRVKIEQLEQERDAARLEAAANLEWVRALQKENSQLKWEAR